MSLAVAEFPPYQGDPPRKGETARPRIRARQREYTYSSPENFASWSMIESVLHVGKVALRGITRRQSRSVPTLEPHDDSRLTRPPLRLMEKASQPLPIEDSPEHSARIFQLFPGAPPARAVVESAEVTPPSPRGADFVAKMAVATSTEALNNMHIPLQELFKQAGLEPGPLPPEEIAQ